MHLNSTQQLLTWWLSFYRAYCATTCQHFMQDEPASSWSKYSNMFQVQVSFLYFFTVKGTTNVNLDEFNYFSYGIWFRLPIVKPVYKPCGQQYHHLSNQPTNTDHSCMCRGLRELCINGGKKCVVYIFNVQISLLHASVVMQLMGFRCTLVSNGASRGCESGQTEKDTWKGQHPETTVSRFFSFLFFFIRRNPVDTSHAKLTTAAI